MPSELRLPPRFDESRGPLPEDPPSDSPERDDEDEPLWLPPWPLDPLIPPGERELPEPL